MRFTELFVLAFSAGLATAKPPALTHLFPAGAQRGQTASVQLGGVTDDMTARVWADHPGIVAQVEKKGVAKITVADDVPLGLHWIRTWNAEGASEARWFSVGTLLETPEVEPNDNLSAPMPVERLPITLNGSLEKGGAVDLFAVQLEAGQTLTAVVEAYALGSPIDPLLELRSPAGNLLMTAHDARSLDPVLVFKAPKAGRYILQLAGFLHPPQSSVSYTGGATVVYRLHLHGQAVATAAYPSALSRTAKTKLTLQGTADLPAKEAALEIDASKRQPEPRIQHVEAKNAAWPLSVLITDALVQQESEPNDAPDKGNPLPPHHLMAGRLDRVGDKDGFIFSVKKGTSYNITLHSRDLLHNLDAKLSIFKLPENALQKDMDDLDGLPDPEISFKSSFDGNALAVVEDLFNKGSPSSQYLISVTPGAEPFSADISSGSSLVIEAGKTVELKAKLSLRYGWSGEPITARVQGLPFGVTADVVTPAAKNGTEFTLVLKAASNAVSWSGPVELSLWGSYKDTPPRTTLGAVKLRGEAERGITALDRLHQIWLTVKPAAPVVPK